MKLSSKLVVFVTFSKLVVVLLFIVSLPFMVDAIVSRYTSESLRDQQKKVLNTVQKNGIAYYLQDDDSYGSYTMLKEEYIALEPAAHDYRIDTIKMAQRVVETDTLTYKVLMHNFKIGERNYLLEIGKSVSSIAQYSEPLQRIALYVLVCLVAATLLFDLLFTRMLIRPLGKIIRQRLINTKFPFKDQQPVIRSSTDDFRYLDQSLVSLMEQINDAFEKEREFTANASHEFMTPISILQNKMENLLGDEQLGEKTALCIVSMMKTLDRLKKISRSLLLISRIDNDQFTKKDRIKPLDLINELIEEIGHRLEEKRVQIDVDISENRELREVNRDLLFQLFYNLVNNAIKFNKPDGRIIISDRLLANGRYQISVQDTGAGIPEDHLPFIFDRFKKVNSAEHIGHGLGLAIVKSISLYHQIDLSVDAKINEGTCFNVSFKV